MQKPITPTCTALQTGNAWLAREHLESSEKQGRAHLGGALGAQPVGGLLELLNGLLEVQL